MCQKAQVETRKTLTRKRARHTNKFRRKRRGQRNQRPKRKEKAQRRTYPRLGQNGQHESLGGSVQRQARNNTHNPNAWFVTGTWTTQEDRKKLPQPLPASGKYAILAVRGTEELLYPQIPCGTVVVPRARSSSVLLFVRLPLLDLRGTNERSFQLD